MLGKQVTLPARCANTRRHDVGLTVYGENEPFVEDANGRPLCQDCGRRDPAHEAAHDAWKAALPPRR